MSRRTLVLFAREPRREAREKGLPPAEGADLFAHIAAGWLEAARRAGARLAVATPPEDVAAWRRRFPRRPRPIWLLQRGGTFGERLERTARRAAEFPGYSILVGGDVVPCAQTLEAAFRALERNADAVLAPARDGGVSLVAVKPEDAALLGTIRPRRRDVFEGLCRGLAARGRRAVIVRSAPDVDGRRGLRALLRVFPLTGGLRLAARRALSRAALHCAKAKMVFFPSVRVTPTGLRAPPPVPAS